MKTAFQQSDAIWTVSVLVFFLDSYRSSVERADQCTPSVTEKSRTLNKHNVDRQNTHPHVRYGTNRTFSIPADSRIPFNLASCHPFITAFLPLCQHHMCDLTSNIICSAPGSGLRDGNFMSGACPTARAGRTRIYLSETVL